MQMRHSITPQTKNDLFQTILNQLSPALISWFRYEGISFVETVGIIITMVKERMVFAVKIKVNVGGYKKRVVDLKTNESSKYVRDWSCT